MICVDLTYRPTIGARNASTLTVERWPLESAATKYTGMVYRLASDSMLGSYLDLPGHILETDDGRRADRLDLADYYRMDAAVIRLDRAGGSGAIGPEELERACGGVPDAPVLILNALGKADPHDIETRSVWLAMDAVEWIIRSGCRLLVSDVYESKALDGVFLKLFAAGVSTVCDPSHLHKLTAKRVKLTVSFMKLPVTQIPCTLLAEF